MTSDVVKSIDEAVLSDLVNQVGDDDGSFRDELIDSYLLEATAQVAGLVSATRTDDAETVRAIAHSLRSSSAVLGAVPLATLLAECERVATTAPSDIGSLAGPVQAEFARVTRALRGLSPGRLPV